MDIIPGKDEVIYLLEKHLNSDLSGQEQVRFAQILKRQRNRSIIADAIEEILHQHRYNNTSGFDKKQLFEQVILKATGRAQADSLPSLQTTTSRSIKKWISYAAAVLILVAAGASFFLYRHSSEKHAAKPVARIQKPLAPNPDKVMLTLADGSRVALDDANGTTLQEKKSDNIAAIGTGKIIYKTASNPVAVPAFNTLTTPHGSQYHIVLPDNSEVWLNATSSLTFPVAFNGNERVVTLTGEGYFEVAKDPAHPFIVNVNDIKVRVLGTHFNIMAYQDEEAVRTTLMEGSVKLATGNANLQLKPGQQGNLARGDDKFSLTKANIEQVLAWKNGEFRFADTGLETIMHQVARWYDVTVNYEGDVKNIELSGIVSRKEKVSELLAILESTHLIRFKVDGKRVTVMPY